MLWRPVIRHDSPRWQPIYTLLFIGFISLSKGKVKMRNQAGFLCTLQLLFFSKWFRQIPAFYTFYITSAVKQNYQNLIRRDQNYLSAVKQNCCTDLGQNVRYFCPIYTYNCAVFQRIISQDLKLHSFNIQDDRSTPFHCTTNYNQRAPLLRDRP